MRFAHLADDMPFMSFQVSVKQAVKNAGKLLKRGGFESVKLEGGADIAEHIRAIVRAGIPVMGHIGLTPQSVHSMGGFRVQGKENHTAERLVNDAIAIEQAGAFSLVIEGVPASVAERVTNALAIPTIGIGAGSSCDGQVLVCYDFLGMGRELKPRFVKHYAELGDRVVEATRSYVDEVRSGAFPAREHTFGANGGLPHADTVSHRAPAVDIPAAYGPQS